MYSNAKRYAKNNSQQRLLTKHFLSYHSLDWEIRNGNGLNLLDIGCGTGETTKDFILKMNSNIAHLTAMDLSQDSIQLAKENNSDERIEYCVADIQDPFLVGKNNWSDKFDKIFSFCTLHWVSDLDQAIKNMFSMLAHGGEAFLTFCVQLDPALNQASKEVMKLFKWQQYFDSSEVPGDTVCNEKWQKRNEWCLAADPEKAVTKLYEDHGFKMVSARLHVGQPNLFQTDQDFIVWLSAFWPALTCLPETKHLDFLSDLLQRYKEIDGFSDDWKYLGKMKQFSIQVKKI